MEIEVKWKELQKILLDSGLKPNQIYAIREEIIGANGVISAEKIIEMLEEFGLKHANIMALLSNIGIKEGLEYTSLIKLAGTYVQYDLSESEGVKLVQMLINDAIANGVVTLPQSAEFMEGIEKLDAHRQGLFLEVNGKLNEATLTGIREIEKKMKANKGVWAVYKKHGIMAALDNYAPNTFIQLAERMPTKKLYVVALEFHKLSDVVAGTKEPISLRAYIKTPGAKPIMSYPFDNDFRGTPLVDGQGKPLLWNKNRGYGIVPYPYDETEEGQRRRKSGPNFISGGDKPHLSVDYNLNKFGDSKVPGFAPFAAYVLKVRRSPQSKNGSYISIRGFVENKEKPGFYDEITLTIYHLDKIPEKIKIGDLVDAGAFLGYGYRALNDEGKVKGIYFCMQTSINGEYSPITKVVDQKRAYIPLVDLKKIPTELLNPELKEMAKRERQKLLR
ncbi:hypothetical protein HYT84_01580 [Candidatus Micrarchaeota archaeon]|nr:hypothetical protein [Candidatus Micrarchaeota archaeon]